MKDYLERGSKIGLNIGDKVRIREFKEEYRDQSPGFLGLMRDLCGEEFVITDTTMNGWVIYKDWKWHKDWLELVEPTVVEEEFDIDPDAFEAMLISFPT